MATESTLCWCP